MGFRNGRTLFGPEFPLEAVTSLRTLGHNVLTSFEAGNANKAIADKDVLAFAAANDRALLTYNRRHFIRLHFLSPDNAGIIVCSKDEILRGAR